MKTPTKRTARRLAAVLSLALALGAATTAEAAIYWTGAQSAAWNNTGNWSGSSGYLVFKDSNAQSKYMEWSGNLTKFTYIASNYKALQFRGGTEAEPFEMNGKGYSYNSSGDTGSTADARAKFTIADGVESTGDSALWFYNGTLKTRTFTAGTASYSAWLKIGNGTYTTRIENTVNDMSFTKGTFIVEANATAKTANSFRAGMDGASAQVDIKGTLTAGSHVAVGGTGSCVMNVNGGTVTVGKQLFLADTVGVTGEMNVNGDSTVTVGQTFGVAIYGTGTFNLNGGIVTVNTGYTTQLSKNSGADGTLNLNGGTLETARIENPGGSGRVVFNGGTLKANNAHSSGLIDASAPVSVGAGGGTIDTGAFNITVPVAINAVENTAGAFTVTGGGSATFSAMGNLAGALTVGDNTALHWFDQDVAVSATCGFTSLALGAGSTIYLDGGATGVDALPATATTTATTESKANIVIDFTAIPATGASFTLSPATSTDVFNVQPMFGSLVLPHEVAVVDGNLVLTIVAEDYTWNGTQTNWGAADAWTKGGAAATWSDGNNAIFNTANATATLAADASPAKIDFTADATVDGTATLKVPVVDVASGVTATISAPTVDPLVKAGTGTLVLGSSRTDETTVSEGTLAMAQGATVVPANLTLGSDSSTPVTFDYAGQTLVSTLTTIVKPGANVTLTNIVLSDITENIYFAKDSAPSVLTVAKGAVLDFGKHYTLNTDNEATFNIAGGTAKTKANENNWLMQTSLSGRLNINVTDGGLMESGGEVYLLTCRDAVDGSTDYQDPSLYFRVVDSTLRVLNTKSFRFGYDQYNRNPVCPTGVFAATNSVIDIGYGISIGNNAVGDNTAGSYTADFENCVITARVLKVYHDRPLNTIRLNNVRYTLNADSSEWLLSSPEFETMGAGGTAIKPITIDAGGLVLDTNGHNGDLQSDPQGAGAITKVGNGILHINRNQTSSSPLVCEGGETYVYDGLSVARAVTVKSGAAFTTKGTGQVALANISFEAGAELRVDEYRSGVIPIAVTTLALPASGTVTLTKNNNFSQGKYRILEKTGIAVEDVQDKLVPATTDNLAYSWSVEGNTLVLTVGTPTGFAWTGFAGDGKMSTDGNWLGNVAPGAGDPADFSAANMAITVEADIDATLGAVTMGSAVVTFTGSLTATSFSDTTKVAVGADSTVTIDGDLMFEGTDAYVVYKVNAGGKFVVTGKLGKAASSTASLNPQESPGTGIIVAGSLVNDGSSGNINAALDNNTTTQKWAIGPGGISGINSTSDTYGIWVFSNNKVNPEFQPYTNDFTVSLWTCLRESAKSLTYNTTGLDGNGYTITLDGGFSDKKAPLYVTGSGTFVVNHVTKSFGGKNAYSGPVTVKDTATLAINEGKKLTSGEITINSGAALRVAQSGTVTLGGNLTFKDGAALGFNYTTRNAPVLALGNKTVTFDEGETTNVVVKISAADGVRPISGNNTLTSGGKFTDATVSLADGTPKWVKDISVVDGDIVIDVKPVGLMVIFR